MITFILGAFTMSHFWLVLVNRTTIENSQFQKSKNEKKPENSIFTASGNNVFDRGYRENWMEVMGNDRILWFCKMSI